MRTAFSSHEQYQVASADILETEVNGQGGAHAPTLILPLRIDLQMQAKDPRIALRFGALQGRIDVGHQPFAVAPAVGMNILLKADFRALQNQYQMLSFPLDAARVTYLERVRNGGDLKMTVYLTLTVEKLLALHEPPIPHDVAWGFVNRLDVHVQQEITVPRSVWIARMLPNIGHGTVHLIELPAVPLAATENFKEAFQSLKKAQELHKNGLYDEAAAACRIALERFFDYPEVTGPDNLTRKIPTLKKSWETKLGLATYDWLNGSLRAIKQATNPTHHQPGPHYDQLEAQILIAVTVAVVAYAAKYNLPVNS